MTRNGKIARLPKHIREQLNRRLQDGEQGKDLVQWLNGLPDVQKVLAAQFGGRPVSEQNLSEWRQGGYKDWLRHEESRGRIRWLTERADDLEDAADGVEISDRLGSLLAAELADIANKLDEIAEPKARWQRLQEILRELWRLRSEDHYGQRMQLQRDRWEREVERQHEADLEQMKKEQKERLIGMCFSPMFNQVMADLFGGGVPGKRWAKFISRIQLDQPIDDLLDSMPRNCSTPVKPNQTESNPIQPN